MIEVIRYTKDKKSEWDSFVKLSDAFSFLFYRDYMEYHSDRFNDYSLMLYEGNKLCALLPGNIREQKLISHQGLTYGGFILKKNTGLYKQELYVESLKSYLKKNKIRQLTLKLQPFFYSSTQDQTLHFLLCKDPDFIVSTDIGAHLLSNEHHFPKRCVRTGKLNEYQLEQSNDLKGFWEILEFNLNKYHNAQAVHSLEEICKLKNRFPENIQLIQIRHKNNSELHAGALLYLSDNIVKVQYFATSDAGRKNRASDVLYYKLIEHYKKVGTYLDFGTNSNPDKTINCNLISTKEKFGITIHPVLSYSINL